MPQQTQNPKDLLQAYRMMTARCELALIAGDPDSANQPLRRLNMATIIGILAGVIACALFGVLGLIFHGGAVGGLTANGTLTIDKDTATAYVPCKPPGASTEELCPALNYASALLALRSASPNTQTVGQSSLAKYKIGPTIGIPGLPQDLPTSGDLVKSPWAICVNPGGVSTLVGGASVGGTALGSSRATLVATQQKGQPQPQDWVLWNGQRMLIDPALMAKVWPGSTPQTVPLSWLNALPANGFGFAPPQVPGASTPGHGPQTVPGPDNGAPARVGQVYQVSGAGQRTQFYVLGGDKRLYPVTQMQAALLVDQPNAPQQQTLSEGQVSNPGASLPGNGLPATTPTLSGATGGAMCVSYSSGTAHSVITGATVPANAASTGGSAAQSGGLIVNQVWLPQGHGALIAVTPTPGQKSTTAYYLLVGSTRYGLTGPGVASYLGYNQSTDQTVLPASLVDALPSGAALDPNTATNPVSG